MKKSILAVAIATLALVSCNKNSENCEPITPNPAQAGTEIVIHFDPAGGEFNTRAFYDNVAAAETWEKKINSVTVLVCNSAGKLVMRKIFSTDEVSSLSANLIIPNECVSTECTFYAVANCQITGTHPTIITKEIEYNQVRPSLYNFSSFDIANSASAMTSGMIMSDKKKVVVQPKGTPTNVSFLLRRPVAKVATKVFIDPSFSKKYGNGKVVVNSIKLINSNSSVPIWNIGSSFNSAKRFEMLQYSQKLSDGSFGNLFYVGESPAVTADDGVILRIDATFDQDGNFETSDDRINTQWNVKLEGSGKGEIKRNAYYRVQATISGMNAIDDIKAVIVADEWETPSTQDAGSLDGKNQNE